MNVINSKQLQELQSMLQQEKAELEKQLAGNNEFGMSEALRDTTGELSSYDNHPADLGSEVFERGKDLALQEHAAHQLDNIKAALSRIENNEYGKCDICGQSIGFERMKAVPTATLCMEHANAENPRGDQNKGDIGTRPVEESFLHPPFGRTDLDDEDQTAFDGEDAWQIVESWGNSNTPALAEDPEINDYNGMYIESDENNGSVEHFEEFIATDIYGENVHVVSGPEYQRYLNAGEGDPLLEPDPTPEQLDDEDGFTTM